MRSKAFLVTILCLLCSATSKARTSLKRGSSISVEDASHFLTSPDKSFTCGFQGVGTKAYWFSVWFRGSKDRTIVWMANRDRPVNGQGSRVHLSDGSMVLTDVDGGSVWKSSNDSGNSTAAADRAELLDNGNLVLKDPSGNILWQSFDFPTDTLLPNQHFRTSNKLVSNLGRGDFGTGYFSLYFDNDNVLKLMYDGPDISSLYWPNIDHNVHDNGRTTNNSSRVAVLDELGSFSSSDQLHFSSLDIGLRVKRRLTMDYDGNLRIYSLDSSTGLWIVTWQAMLQLCKVHGICGRNGICVYTPEPKCSCPPGYEVTDARNLKMGCKRTLKRTCSKSGADTFVQIPQTCFYGFDLGYYTEGISISECRELCLKDCRCEAFIYRLNGEGSCFTKTALFNGFKTPNFEGTLYLRMPASVEAPLLVNKLNALDACKSAEAQQMYENTSKSVRWVYLYWFASAAGAVEIVFILLGWWLLVRRHGARVPIEDGYHVISSQFRKFRYDELKKATNAFKDELGRGASGAVFKGVLEDERVVAVKKLADIFQGEDVFWAEVSIIGKVNHMNLVRIWGFCSEDKHRLLVSEFVENGSLDKQLFSQKRFLGWQERFKVAIGVAKGLAYLHHECLEWVIHCDVKPENILLDSDFEAKIADFGLAKLTQRGKQSSMFSRVRGTKGYMAPEWARNLPITAKMDVYSYGVVILELVKGIRLSNWVIEDGDEIEAELTRCVRIVKRKLQFGEDLWIEDMIDPRLKGLWIEDMIDPRLKGHFSRKQAEQMVKIGISCVEEDRNKRPTKDSVVHDLLECEDECNVHP